MTHNEKHVCITRQNQEAYLCRELRIWRPSVQCTEVAPQVVELSDISLEELTKRPLFFSAQLLPDARKLSAASIKSWGTVVTDTLANQFGDSPPTWSLHIFDPATAETGKSYSRPRLIYQEILTQLKQRRRSLLRTLDESCPPESTLVQLVVLSPDAGFLSVAPPSLRRECGASISSCVAGYVAIADDQRPPSRAFKKLREAISVFNLQLTRGQTAVDLGASPGGWTHVLADYGLSVTAVDRSPLDPSLRQYKSVTFVKGNAFTWLPERPVDWLVCDVITTPQRTLELLKQWINKKLCKNLCVTIKFKGAPDFVTLREVIEFLGAYTAHFDGRQLSHNKNEVTVIGTV